MTINDELMLDIRGRDVLLVDDIFDTGHTLVQVLDKMQAYEPNSLRSAVLLRKNGRQEVDAQPDFVAFDIPDEFVVGYGLDYEDMYRNLPYLGALEEPDLVAHAKVSAGLDCLNLTVHSASAANSRLPISRSSASSTRPNGS